MSKNIPIKLEIIELISKIISNLKDNKSYQEIGNLFTKKLSPGHYLLAPLF